jgi:predicted dehydrogenase
MSDHERRIASTTLDETELHDRTEMSHALNAGEGMSASYRAAIVGCSGIAIARGTRTAGPYRSPVPHSHAAAFDATPNANVVAVCDIFESALANYLSTWGAANTYTDYREMFEKEQLDLVSIVTPDHLHADVFVAACDAGVKGIFCEKPISTVLADADRMIEAAERSGVKVVVNHTRRFDPFFRHAKWLVEQGTIGEITSVIGTMGGERAMLFRNGTHVVDTMLYFLDAQPTWLFATLDDAEAGYGPVYKGDGGRNPDTDPAASALIGFTNGARAFYNGSKRTVTNFEIDVQGSKGRIQIGNQIALLSLESSFGGLSTQPLPLQADSRAGMVVAIEALIDLVENDGVGVAALRAARTTLTVLLGILESADRGGARINLANAVAV